VTASQINFAFTIDLNIFETDVQYGLLSTGFFGNAWSMHWIIIELSLYTNFCITYMLPCNCQSS